MTLHIIQSAADGFGRQSERHTFANAHWSPVKPHVWRLLLDRKVWRQARRGNERTWAYSRPSASSPCRISMTGTLYTGTSRKLVIAFDIGTTYSGAAYAFLDRGEAPKITPVTK